MLRYSRTAMLPTLVRHQPLLLNMRTVLPVVLSIARPTSFSLVALEQTLAKLGVVRACSGCEPGKRSA
ncbi:hypothetical protein LX15_005208 [Streptoalloteichus tenebrarius]|uniref:Uncharacterized protein n=1 Tax=Streptoalloteichus tenebrarius (strain ATCC 17920 / DSM 40477 / JCM 4838 / CBS 697.72 / NBRC 16177 / NCIMB 11028 / NRRL B-12390 / A12253. 1 / ISP 5477) TaxID=1933 RepID=A0ABT1I124_STRSD|nr:hypothetical protein [Streptoalloteichus tenebrarius]